MSKILLKKIIKYEIIIKTLIMIGMTPLLLIMFMLSGRSGVELDEAFVFVIYIQIILSGISYVISRKNIRGFYEKIIYILFEIIYSLLICSIITCIYNSIINR